MSVSKKQYDKMTKKATPPSPWFRNCVCAFFTGGTICTFGQLLFNIYSMCGMFEQEARTAVSVTLVAITAFL
ncbi:MAG: SpoVA/SpoVAEb family sporulation membrane protein, partial [Acutalibacteraceae bacterium]|nr:SpoVA/SpoVAEb family sporulation membrane protein [Acutalibacteraceae bacterium]